MSGYTIRDASERDASVCAEIYAPYVTDTAISFETEPPTVQEMAARIGRANRSHAWLVLEADGRVIGYAYGGAFKEGQAFPRALKGTGPVGPERSAGRAGRAPVRAVAAPRCHR